MNQTQSPGCGPHTETTTVLQARAHRPEAGEEEQDIPVTTLPGPTIPETGTKALVRVHVP